MRCFRLEDAPAFAAYRSDAEVAKYQGWHAPFTLAEATSLIDEQQRLPVGTLDAWCQIAIDLKQTGQLIGDCAFCVPAADARQAEIGFTLAPAYQRQGYATEAVTRLLEYLFEELVLHRVRATCDVDNLASVRLLERLRMRREAHCIECTWFKEQWSSEYLYAILRREWTGTRDTAARGTRTRDTAARGPA